MAKLTEYKDMNPRAKAVVEGRDFENRMLKAYIRDWPAEDAESPKA